MNTIKIECIGDGTPRRRDCGVWELTGVSQDGLIRRALKPHRDYATANGIGSRGVFAYYFVEDGKVYEVKAPRSWTRTDHYYATFGYEQEWRLSVEEVFQCLANARLGNRS